MVRYWHSLKHRTRTGSKHKVKALNPHFLGTRANFELARSSDSFMTIGKLSFQSASYGARISDRDFTAKPAFALNLSTRWTHELKTHPHSLGP